MVEVHLVAAGVLQGRRATGPATASEKNGSENRPDRPTAVGPVFAPATRGGPAAPLQAERRRPAAHRGAPAPPQQAGLRAAAVRAPLPGPPAGSGRVHSAGDRLREEAPLARSNEDLARRFVDACRQTRTILPTTTTIERLCADALVDAERAGSKPASPNAFRPDFAGDLRICSARRSRRQQDALEGEESLVDLAEGDLVFTHATDQRHHDRDGAVVCAPRTGRGRPGIGDELIHGYAREVGVGPGRRAQRAAGPKATGAKTTGAVSNIARGMGHDLRQATPK